MNSLETVTTFLGWCSVINILILTVTSLFLMFAKGFVSGIQSKILGIEPENLQNIYVHYLGNYKIAIFMLNVVPYFALKIMA